MVDFSDRTRTDAFMAVWSVTEVCFTDRTNYSFLNHSYHSSMAGDGYLTHYVAICVTDRTN